MTLTQIKTWADYHPEVDELFRRPWIDWPCQHIDTGLTPSYQPSITTGPAQELFTAGMHGEVFHSQDLGKTWSLLGTSAAFNPQLPEGHVVTDTGCSGIGVTERGTILLVWYMRHHDGRQHGSQASPNQPQLHEDDSYHMDTWMTRSCDRGQSWEPTARLDPSPFDIICDQATLLQLRDGRIMVPFRVQAWSRPGRSVSRSANELRSIVYCSDDDGRTWSQLSRFPDYSPEPHLLELPGGEILAYIRYQRVKLPEDPPELATDQRLNAGSGEPTDLGQAVFQHSAITSSTDGGMTWTTPRLVTASAQQSGSLIRLSDGTLIMTFGRYGQRFMLSYDNGHTWGKAVYQLYQCGQYARSVALDDDTIVTVHDNRETWSFQGRLLRCYDNTVVTDGTTATPHRLGVLRWRAPSRSKVSKDGFFTPREVEAGIRNSA
jgi:hypothetical protein